MLLDVASTIGIRLAMAGAETYRVEESVIRILQAYGYEAKVYSVPNSLLVTIDVPDGPPITSLSRIKRHGNNFEVVEQYSNLCRRICEESPSPEEAIKWIQIQEKNLKEYQFVMKLLGHFLVAAGFCVFFGGNLQDSFFAGLCGIILGTVDLFLDNIGTVNIFISRIAAAFVMAISAHTMHAIGWISNIDASIIGTLMLLVPGLLFTNAIRDIIFGDTNSGINKIVEVLLIAAAVAVGIVAAGEMSNFIWGVVESSQNTVHSSWITCVASFVACAGFVIVFNIHGYGNMLCALGGSITWGIYCIVAKCGGSEYMCCFIATVGAAIFSEVMARIRKYPAISYLVISLLPLIPGAGVFYTAKYAFQSNWYEFVHYGSTTLITAGVMAIGILLASSAVRVITNNRTKYFRRIDKEGNNERH